MANIPIAGKVTVGGTAKDISGGYVNIGGVWKPIVKTYVNIGGVWKSAWKNLTTWKKYTVVNSTKYVAQRSSDRKTMSGTTDASITCASTYRFDESTGKFILVDYVNSTLGSFAKKPYFHYANSMSENTNMREYSNADYGSLPLLKVYYYEWTSTTTTTKVQGEYISDVSSEDESAYPDNGVHTDGYWYVKQ